MGNYEWGELKDFRKEADQKKVAQAVLGEVDPPKIRYENQVEAILKALFYSEIPKGCVDYLLDCYENTLASIPESMHKAMWSKAKKRNSWDYDEDDWRRSDVFTVWRNQLKRFLNLSRITTTDAQVRRDLNWICFGINPSKEPNALESISKICCWLIVTSNASYDDVVRRP